jgi:hypothetical protein
LRKGIFFGKKKPVPIIHTYATITPESIKKNAKKQWLSIVKQPYKQKKGIIDKTEGNQFFMVL